MPSITFKAIGYYYLFIQNHYILTLFISSLFARLNQPSRKISEPEHLHGARPQLPTVKGPLHAGQRKLFPHQSACYPQTTEGLIFLAAQSAR